MVATAAARTFAEVKVAGERFGRAVGEDGARVLFVLASLAMGKDLHGILKRLPRAPPSGPALVAELPGGMRVRLPALKPPSGTAGAATAMDGGKVVSVTVVGDRFVVAMAAGAGGAAGGGLSGGSGAASVSGSPAPSSKRLAANLESAGVRRPQGTDAHHIVAANAEAAGSARAVLHRFGVDIDDAANGVFLPSNSHVINPAPGSVHSTIHTNEYYSAVDFALRRARSRQDVLEILSQLRQMLLSGSLP
ncbi:AHH domain-containing protein [Pyxidicoccus trucidator]|uniref:AHH domain-containing protein n=1 Tax=Pyxidicoccus trucidator TaxID=2709662 RepID=UPI0013D9A38D|nr:AHH domain-containing protein [Pyxidicoccus trucidator]